MDLEDRHTDIDKKRQNSTLRLLGVTETFPLIYVPDLIAPMVYNRLACKVNKIMYNVRIGLPLAWSYNVL